MEKSMTDPVKILSREYEIDEIADLERDVSEAFDPDMNSRVSEIDQESGYFCVTIEWRPDEG